MKLLKTQNIFAINFLRTLDLTQYSISRCRLPYFALANIRLHRYDTFFRFILLFSCDENINSGPTSAINNTIPLYTLPFHN